MLVSKMQQASQAGNRVQSILGLVCVFGLMVVIVHIVMNVIGVFIGSDLPDPNTGHTFPIRAGFRRLFHTVYVSEEFRTVYDVFQWGAYGFIACFVSAACVVALRKYPSISD